MITSLINNLFSKAAKPGDSTEDPSSFPALSHSDFDNSHQEKVDGEKQFNVGTSVYFKRKGTPFAKNSANYNDPEDDVPDAGDWERKSDEYNRCSRTTPPLLPLRHAAKSRLDTVPDPTRKRNSFQDTNDADCPESSASKKFRNPAGLEEESSSVIEPHSMQPELMPSFFSSSSLYAKTAPAVSSARDTSACSPKSPDCFDEVQMRSRRAKAFGLVRPEDFTSATPKARRLARFRTAESTLWMRALNNAVIEKDHSRVRDLLLQEPKKQRFRSDAQFEGLLRCSTMFRDWKTLAVLLCYSERHLENARDIIEATRDLIILGATTGVQDVAAARTCLNLLMCSYGKLPRHNPNAQNIQMQMTDLEGFCRNDDVVSLAVGLLHYLKNGRVTTPMAFCDMETSMKVSPSTLVDEVVDDPVQDKERAMTVSNSYFTPNRPFRGCDSDNEDEDPDMHDYYTHMVIPVALNCRKATLNEFAAMICAPFTVAFLCDVAAQRLI